MAIENFVIEKQEFAPGDKGIVKLNVGRLPSDTRINMLAHIYRSKKPGPTTLILAGIHGDEINGIEIVRHLLHSKKLKKIHRGSVIVIPLVNIYGFINFNRYVPDGKDVNRSFPGTQKGSLASRIARTLTKNILPIVDYIFDFHTGGDSRYNYPQIRYTKTDKGAFELAKVFNPPFIIQNESIPMTLRRTAENLNKSMVIFEGGESIRLCGESIDLGYKGMLRALHHLGHLKEAIITASSESTVLIKKTSWLRAGFSGIFIWSQSSGTKVLKGEKLGTINGPNGLKSVSVICKKGGYIIGHNNASVVNQGDALFHIGYEFENIN